MPEPKDDLVPPFARAVLELFHEHMREVRFPDLDHDSLTALVDELNAARFEVECVEAARASAHEVLRARARALTAHAARGLSYARIYAAENQALTERVAQIEQLTGEAKSRAAAPGKKRGRPRKASATDTHMFADVRESAAHEEAAA